LRIGIKTKSKVAECFLRSDVLRESGKRKKCIEAHPLEFPPNIPYIPSNNLPGLIAEIRIDIQRSRHMVSRAAINEFMAQKKLALMRASRKTPVAGFSIDKELYNRGYSVQVVYLDEENPGSRLSELKDQVGGVIIAVPAVQSEKAVRHAIEAKIPRVWLQTDSESDAAIKLCNDNGISVVHGQCLMMFAEPVRSVHAFHRWIAGLFGKVPK